MVNQLFWLVLKLFRPLWLFPTIIGRWFPHSKLFWNATADMLQREKRLLICNLLVSMFPAIRNAICFHNFNNWPFRASKSNTFRTFVADGKLTKLGGILSIFMQRNKRNWVVNTSFMNSGRNQRAAGAVFLLCIGKIANSFTVMLYK